MENFDNYCRNLIKKTRKLIRQTQIGVISHDDELTFDDETLGIPENDFELPIQVENKEHKNRSGEENVKNENTEMDKVEFSNR